MVEYWKSAPYLYNFMDEYAAKKRMREALPERPDLRAALVGDHRGIVKTCGSSSSTGCSR